jgi:hypothetical protein
MRYRIKPDAVYDDTESWLDQFRAISHLVKPFAHIAGCFGQQ